MGRRVSAGRGFSRGQNTKIFTKTFSFESVENFPKVFKKGAREGDWSHRRESNPGPLLYESIALPAELRWQEKNNTTTLLSHFMITKQPD